MPIKAQRAHPTAMDDSVAPDDRVHDEDLVVQRYNTQLPPSYRAALEIERTLPHRALHVLSKHITSPSSHVSPPSDLEHQSANALANGASDSNHDENTAEAYQHEIERDFAALEKGISRYLDFKNVFDASDNPVFFDVTLRVALTPNLDIGLRSRLVPPAPRPTGPHRSTPTARRR